jgi:hypothetical protein
MFFGNDVVENAAEGSASSNKVVSRTGEFTTEPAEAAIKNLLGVVGGNLKSGIQGLADTIGGEIKSLLSPAENFERLAYLDEQSAKINKTLGLGAQKAGEFKDLIVEASSKYAKLGLKMDDIAKDYVALSNTFGSNISVTDETMTELAATSVVTGSKVEELAPAFRGVGVEISGIAPRMMEVTKVAKESGAIVGQVAGLVVKNLEKMNLYNFEGGVKGLAKMSAQASKLGINMESIFALTEKVFNPEGAIETAAALQRLGVQTSALLDPLSLMDMSANDPTELQNQIVNMTKDFVKFNKDLGEFQILPGEKRRLREVADALGMSAGELAKMSLNAANLEYKMKQIKFSTNMPKEDREMIASMAQINKQGIAEVKVKQFVKNEKGEEEWTGRYEMVDASKISAKQLEALKEQQALEGATMEEIAIKQQGELESLNNSVDAIKKAIAYGAAGSAGLQATYSTMTTGARKALFDETEGLIGGKEKMQAEYWREATENVTEKLGKGFDYVVEKITSIDSLESAWNTLGDLGTKLSDFVSSFSWDNIKKTYEKVGEEVNKENKSYGTYELLPMKFENTTAVSSNVNTSNVTETTNQTNTNTTAKTEATLNNNVSINVSLDEASKNQALTTMLNTEIVKYLADPTNINKLFNAIAAMQTSNGNIISNVVKE